ncbi:MAG: pseudouridine synthase [Candidatus Nomurabacteria bacterium]|nr:pseudouridine synthase [Candidatus Nomurabacteria bacterium]
MQQYKPKKKKLTSRSPIPNKEPYPMRINKYLALKNYATRRNADELITSKKVTINGVLAKIGDKIKETDMIEVKYGKEEIPKYSYYAFNKPVGMITSSQEKEEEDIISSLPAELKKINLFPLGRLDRNSHGLILLTNDGRVTDRLLNPKYEHQKEYEVVVARKLRDNFKEKMEGGINIEGYVTKPAKIKVLSENKFSITIIEGKTHQIRRMVSAVFNEVEDLKRISVMNIKLLDLKTGVFRPILGKELAEFLKSLAL